MPTPGFGGPVAPVRQQFSDSNGNPLAGGRVYHYLPNTTTVADTWADPDFTILNTNPVVLDAAGRAAIYSNQTLRQVLYDRNGTLIWDGETVTTLGVNSSGALTINNIAALRANTTNYPLFYVLGYYTPNDGQAATYWLDQADTTTPDNGGTTIVDASGHRYKLLDNEGPIDVRKFGAKGDGVTVDTTAFANAIAYGQATSKAILQSQGAYITTTDADDVSSYPLTLTTVEQLNINEIPYPFFIVLGYYTPRDGGGGLFQWDVTDNASADNGGTIIVDADGRRYKRVYDGMLNVKWFGAKGDGATDDTATFQAVAALGISYTIPFAPNGYLITAQITHNSNGQYVYGSSRDSPIKGSGNFNTFVFNGAADTCGMFYVYFESTAKTGGYDVSIDEAFKVRLQGLWFSNPYAGFRVLRTNNCIMEDIITTTYRGPHGGLFQGTDAGPCIVLTLKDYKASPSLSGIGGPALEIDGRVSTICLVSFQVNGQPAGASKMTHGLKVHNAIGATVGARFMWAYDVEIDYPSSHGMDLDDCLSYYFFGGYIQGAGTDRAISDPPAHGVRYGTGGQHCRLSGMYIRAPSGDGIHVEGADLLVDGCDILGSSWIPELGKYDGVYCAGSSERVRVANNRIGNIPGAGATTRYGVYAAAGAVDVAVVGNDLQGNRLAPFRDDSGGLLGNFAQSSNIGVPYSLIGGVTTGSQTGFNGAATPTIGGGGVITGGIVTDPGFFYFTAPTVTAYDPQALGSGAALGATVANGKITSITGGGGANYSADTVLVITPASGPVAVRAFFPNVTDLGLQVAAQGNGTVQIGSENGDGLVVSAPPNSGNYVAISGSPAGTEVQITSQGVDTDIDLALVTKGTSGRLRLDGPTNPAAGSLIGYLEVKIGASVVKIPYYNV